ncbi:MAG TPA: hypothetical protein IAB26_02205, partial [Candidatus Limivivens merdigallinarum]|nr:hypothetical protein [Candidatus Limivivens merdigallinarum]
MSGSTAAGKNDSFHAIPPNGYLIDSTRGAFCIMVMSYTLLYRIVTSYTVKKKSQEGNLDKLKNNMSNSDRNKEKNKIEDLYVPEEMAEDKELDEIIRKLLIEDADAEEEALKDYELPGPVPTEEMFDNIVKKLKEDGLWGQGEEVPESHFAVSDDTVNTNRNMNASTAEGSRHIDTDAAASKETAEAESEGGGNGLKAAGGLSYDEITQLLSEEDRKALQMGKKVLKGGKRRKVLHVLRWIATTAAVVVIGVFTISMGSDANRERAVAIWNSLVGGELEVNISDAENSIVVENEQLAYDEISQVLDAKQIQFLYRPASFVYKNYSMDKKLKTANIFYECDNDLITVSICKVNSGINRD